MANFLPIVKSAFNSEGGYQAYPNDSANYNSKNELVGTNRGISAIAYEQYIGHPPSASEMKAITQQTALDVYKKLFWDKIKGDAIKNDSVAQMMFEAFIASGGYGIQRIRKAINIYNGKQLVAEVVTQPLTNLEVNYINSAAAQKMFDILKQGEINNRKALAVQNPDKYQMFLKGWIDRLTRITFNQSAAGIAILMGLFFLAVILTEDKSN